MIFLSGAANLVPHTKQSKGPRERERRERERAQDEEEEWKIGHLMTLNHIRQVIPPSSSSSPGVIVDTSQARKNNNGRSAHVALLMIKLSWLRHATRSKQPLVRGGSSYPPYPATNKVDLNVSLRSR